VKQQVQVSKSMPSSVQPEIKAKEKTPYKCYTGDIYEDVSSDVKSWDGSGRTIEGKRLVFQERTATILYCSA